MKGTSQTTPRPPQGQRPPASAEQFLQRGDWWKDEGIRKELNLTPRQVNRINAIFEGRVREATPFFDEFQKQLAELERLTKERTVAVATYTVQVNRAEALRSKLNETRYVMLYRILRELDPTQHQKLRELLDRRRNSRGGGPPAPRSW
jgi:Spy/CpxP family protein refolding chaperone